MVRNITGEVTPDAEYSDTLAQNTLSGVFAYQTEKTKGAVALDHTKGISPGFTFDAARVVPTSSENRPISVAFIPIINF